ncbi:MAG: hypothetical protein C0404_07885 [Verrucomicrobia bacterium]|nr:hypothetical protein [Verrucomicrobiota bacterium]
MVGRLAAAIVLSFAGCAFTQEAGDNAERARNKAAAEKMHQANLKQYEGKADFLVLPGLVADKTANRVTVLAETSGQEAGTIAEFLLISERSGHDYEAFSISYALPSDVVKALTFIGMQPGIPADEAAFRFWPKGERVIARCGLADSKNEKDFIRMERLLKNTRTEKVLPESGLVFVGSVMVDSREKPGQKVLAADEAEPNAIISTYNEKTTVLDLPRLSPQKSIYGQMVLNSGTKIPTNSLIKIVMEPEYPAARKRVKELLLSIAPRTGTKGQTLEDLEFKLTGGDGQPVGKNATLNSTLEAFSSLIEKGHDPFVTFKPDGRLTLKAIHDSYNILSSVESEKGIRIEPPPAGTLYFKAFLPPDVFRDRSSRGGQPWELRLALKDGKVDGILTRIEEIFPEDKVEIELKPYDYPVSSPESLRDEMAKHEVKFNVLLVFAPPEMTHDQLMTFVGLVRKTHPKIHVFLQTPEEPKAAREQK